MGCRWLARLLPPRSPVDWMWCAVGRSPTAFIFASALSPPPPLRNSSSWRLPACKLEADVLWWQRCSWLEAHSCQLTASGSAATKEPQLPAATAGSSQLEETESIPARRPLPQLSVDKCIPCIDFRSGPCLLVSLPESWLRRALFGAQIRLFCGRKIWARSGGGVQSANRVQHNDLPAQPRDAAKLPRSNADNLTSVVVERKLFDLRRALVPLVQQRRVYPAAADGYRPQSRGDRSTRFFAK
jgi:hypothetical protein